MRSPNVRTGSIVSRRQSPSPTAESEKRPSSGGTSLPRASVIADARSVPNQGFARAPSTGLRVVATSKVGLTDSAAASRFAPVEESALHPPRKRARESAREAGARAGNRPPRATAGRGTTVLAGPLPRPLRTIRMQRPLNSPLADDRSRQEQGEKSSPVAMGLFRALCSRGLQAGDCHHGRTVACRGG